MKIRKLRRKLKEILDEETRERVKHREELKTLLGKMKRREQELKESVRSEHDEDRRARLRKDIDMLHAQRRKGLKALQDMTDG